MENAEVAALFEEIADLIDLQEGNDFRIRAYRQAAATIRNLPGRLSDIAGEKNLSDLPNIGEGLAERIHEILERGTCETLERLRERVPRDLTKIMKIPRMGPRKAMRIYEELGVETLDQLRKACQGHRIRELEGFGAKTEETILEGLEMLEAKGDRVRLTDAEDYLESLGRFLDEITPLGSWQVSGSYRRRKETVGDLDILLVAKNRQGVIEKLVEYPAVSKVLGKGEERVSVRLDSGFQIDFRFVEKKRLGAAMIYFTGSKDHNVNLRRIAQERDWKLNEYGLFKEDRLLAGVTEEAIYHRLSLDWIAPEMREDRGEIEAARENRLPTLVEMEDIRGDLHSHTDVTDGALSIQAMAQAAMDRGYQYLAITDHSKRVTVADGLDEDGIREHAERIRNVDEELENFWLLAGVEVDILKSGKLDLEESVLEELDWVIASVHYDLDLEEGKMTDRLVAAVSSGVVHCLGHPLSRKIGKRRPIRCDWDRVIEACLDHGVRLELNAQPDRLDLPSQYCQEAKKAGVGFTIGTDAHKASSLNFMRLGVSQARRGWLESGDVLNTLDRTALKKELGR